MLPKNWWGAGRGCGELHLRHMRREAKLSSVQLRHSQSPGRAFEWSGWGVWHLRHTDRDAKFRSRQLGQYQSPGLVGCGWCC
jgi:hypothetical protein